MSLYIPKMSDTPGVTIPGLASNFNALADSRIVEQGSNENGEYVRWENGLQVCWRVVEVDLERTQTNVQSITMPALFASLTTTSASFSSSAYPGSNTARSIALGMTVVALSDASWAVWRPAGYTFEGTHRCTLTAIGRWK